MLGDAPHADALIVASTDGELHAVPRGGHVRGPGDLDVIGVRFEHCALVKRHVAERVVRLARGVGDWIAGDGEVRHGGPLSGGVASVVDYKNPTQIVGCLWSVGVGDAVGAIWAGVWARLCAPIYL